MFERTEWQLWVLRTRGDDLREWTMEGFCITDAEINRKLKELRNKGVSVIDQRVVEVKVVTG